MRGLFISLGWVVLLANAAWGQTRALPPGFQRVEGRYVDLITDMPLDDEIRELPSVFDAAVPIWCRTFGVDASEVADWHSEAFLMLDRPRFQTAGLIPDHLPNFPYGFQYGNQMWVSEQPSPYYRRHLLLHEGTHWFMTRRYGNNGPPWLMEGMAEWLGTHRWDRATQTLAMGIIPRTKREVPFWGRISLIQDQLAGGLAPSLETILRYDDTAHQHVDAYAWSWAAVLFLKNHPDTQATFQKLLERPMRSDHSLARWLFNRLRADWPSIRQEWNAMLTELEYGYDPTRRMLVMSDAPSAMGAEAIELEIQANQSWQSSGIHVPAGASLQVSATGEYSVGNEPQPWRCRPDGVTLEYYRGEPLGKLLMTVVAPLDKEPRFSTPITTIAVGSASQVRIPVSGELHFRVNETSAGLADNNGQIRIQVEP